MVTIVIPTIDRPSLRRAMLSVEAAHLPSVVIHDRKREGRSITRNRGVAKVSTEWVGFLDDDDHIAPTYRTAFEEALRDQPDVIIFKVKRPDGYQGMWPDQVLPRFHRITPGNVGINWCARTELIRQYPFPDGVERHEETMVLGALEAAGAKICWSPHITYLVRDARL